MIDKIALDEREDEDDGKTAEEIRKEMEAKEMKAQAQILEMVGDLHYADEKPPDNVLFVCKLNPVTTSEVSHIFVFCPFNFFIKLSFCRTWKSFFLVLVQLWNVKSSKTAVLNSHYSMLLLNLNLYVLF